METAPPEIYDRRLVQRERPFRRIQVRTVPVRIGNQLHMPDIGIIDDSGVGERVQNAIKIQIHHRLVRTAHLRLTIRTMDYLDHLPHDYSSRCVYLANAIVQLPESACLQICSSLMSWVP